METTKEQMAGMPREAGGAIRIMPETASNEPKNAQAGVACASSEQAATLIPSGGVAVCAGDVAAGASDVSCAGDEECGCYVSVAEKSPQSKPAQIMRELGLRRVVWFVLRGGTDEQREYLHSLIGGSVVCRLPLSRPHRQMIICRAYDVYSDTAHIRFYRAVLRLVFGEKCRISVRVMRCNAQCIMHNA